MGKGDKKSKKGKIWKGSYGNSRKRKANRVKTLPRSPVAKQEADVVTKQPKAKKAAPKKKAKTAE